MNHKTLIMLLILLVLVAGGLFATDSRMTALGYPYGFLRDNTDIHAYPATIFKYNRSMTGELYDAGDDWNWTLGANVPINSSVFGLYLNLPTGVDVGDHLDWNYGYRDTDLDISKKIQFYFGFMDKFALGFGMAIDSEKYETDMAPAKTDYTEEMSAHYFEVSAGMSTDMMDLGAKVYLQGATVGDDESNAYIDESSYSGIGLVLNGRYFIKESNNLDLVAITSLGYESIGDMVEYNPETKVKRNVDYSTMMFNLGVGADYKISPNHHIVMSITPFRLLSYSETESYTDSVTEYKEGASLMFVPEYTLGLESQIAKWLTGRIGASQSYVFYKWTNNVDYGEGSDYSSAESQYDSSFDMNLGLAFKLGKFSIDTVLSKSLLHDGPEFLSGKTGGLASQVSVKFEF